ncbi:MAG TPA: hypothetical protein VK698_17880 [Kofleriaceae bacterium]|nr:hypothetical protein [Kofleriaceae bacterium]
MRLAHALALALLAALAAAPACGSDGGSTPDGAPADAAPPDAGPGGVVCDPVAQTGCAAGDKCAQLVLSLEPGDVRTACVPDGTVEVGGACVTGEPGEATGYDDCAAGADCTSGSCRRICLVAGDSCPDQFSCSTYLELFKDITETLVGVCDAVCDPIAQDCPAETDACYLRITDEAGEATCVGVPDESEGREQNDDCSGPFPGKCYANGCAGGYHPVELNGNATCSAYCRPVATYLDDPDGDGEGALVGNPIGEAPSDCATERVGVDGQQCRFFQALISDVTGEVHDQIPAGYGFCAPSDNPLIGDCSIHSEEQLWRIYDEAGGGDGGEDAVDAFCADEASAGKCAPFCVSLEVLDQLLAAYCAAPPVDPSPMCARGDAGRAWARRSLAARGRRALSAMTPSR